MKNSLYLICEMRAPRKRRARDVREKGTERGFMKKICVLFVLVLLSGSVLPAVSVPGYDGKVVTIMYDPDGYNVKLLNKLRDDFKKKYCKEITPGFPECYCPKNAYDKEVLEPYYENRIPAPGVVEEQQIFESLGIKLTPWD